MKKTIIMLVTILTALFCLCSCSKPEEETSSVISLNTTNYDKYIAINVYYEDCQIVSKEPTASETVTKYDLMCIGHIATAKKIDCNFKDVSITFNISMLFSWDTNTLISNPSANLSFEGDSHCSFFTKKIGSYLLDFPHSNQLTITVSKISGSVLV